MISEEVLNRIKSVLQDVFKNRLQGVMLYGSEARGEAGPESDIDLLVLLSGPVNRREDLWACICALYPLVLEIERPIHSKPVDVEHYKAQIMPLYREVKHEGMLV
jgi:predicted nucleotidyltransferase